jgi:uncharacterized protein YjbI with pentapeptide repeats
MVMAKGKGTFLTEEGPDKRPPWWKRLWARTGFGDKTLWDLLQLLIVPLVLVGIGLLFEMQQAERQQALEEQQQALENRRAEAERELAQQRAQDEALQAYLDQMSSLLLEKDLRTSEEGSEVRTLARARTLTVLGRLDSDRKTNLLRFLYEAKLIDKGEPVLDLAEANFAKTDLSGRKLSNISLAGAILTKSDLTSTELNEADLRGSRLQGAELELATLRNADLTGATLSTEEEFYPVGSSILVYGKGYQEVEPANLSGADLTDANLEGALLGSVDMGPRPLGGLLCQGRLLCLPI